jgi:hypothetical protein
MAYRYQMTLGVCKAMLARALVDNTFFPDILQTEAPIITEEGGYWQIHNMHAYDQLTVVVFLQDLPEDDELFAYGAIFLGDDTGDLVEYGDPYEFNIESHTSIDCPVFDNTVA